MFNLILNTIIHVLIFILLLSFYINNKNDTNVTIFILVGITIFVCYLLEFVRKPDIMKMNFNNNNNNNLNEGFSNNVPNRNYKMGEYDQLVLNDSFISSEKYPDDNCGWRKRPCNVGLLSDVGQITPTGLEKKYVPDPVSTKNMVGVEGGDNEPKSLFMFTYNQSHPDCCPSTFSNSTGCVCTTKAQRDFINKRGHNRYPNYPGI
tara:strand:+ start:145 stop:759 length:615 start_codon:yes stop_codon:yes gene_type:complete